MTPPGVQRPLAGVALILLTTLCFAALDTSAKLLGTVVPVLVMLWARYTVQAVAMGAWFAGTRRLGLLRSVHPRFQLVRGLLLLGVSAMSYLGLRDMPVAEFTAVVMLTPVIVTVLAALVYAEHVSPLRWALVAGGFAGALVILRPGSGLFGWVALFPALGALGYAAFQLLTRRLAGLEHPLTTHFHTGLIGSLACLLGLVVMHAIWGVRLDHVVAADAGLLLLLGLLGTVGHLLLILAFGMAPISLLTPFTYMQIFFAALAGGGVFGHVPDRWAVAGMAVVAGCGAAAVWLNARESQAPHRPVPDSVVAADTLGD
ncbi:MAG TPA: DMT family transporter [Burkholderiaceae bacterium]|nr:DMT family transporter [Burkholderiaceae bacterium]